MRKVLEVVAIIVMLLSGLAAVFALLTAGDPRNSVAANATIVAASISVFMIAGGLWILANILDRVNGLTKASSNQQPEQTSSELVAADPAPAPLKEATFKGTTFAAAVAIFVMFCIILILTIHHG